MPCQILPPHNPHRLYRYRNVGTADKLAREVKSIKGHSLYFSNFKSMNDPMEGFYRPSSSMKIKSDYELITDNIYNNKIRVGIVSFSTDRDNELLWTHYSGNYEGVCIAYSTERLILALNQNFSLARVAYDYRAPRISGNSQEDIYSILQQKKDSWSYEREWRLLSPQLGEVKLRQQCVTHVYFGSRTSELVKTEFMKLKRNRSIAFSEMIVDGYQHEWVDL